MVLPVHATRLCPDCDILTEQPVCPVCGRDQTFPVAPWLSPLKAARPASVGRMPAHVRRGILRAPVRRAS